MMNAKICVLMSTYNGEKYIKEQIDSILAQTCAVDLFVRDDGSCDSTQEILQTYSNQGVLRWYTGKNMGPGKSFFNLIQQAPYADYYAFADQDDVWNKEKIQKAIEMLSKYSDAVPNLYCGEYIPVDDTLHPIKIRKRNKNAIPTLGSALVECIAPGCTFVFNYKALEMFKQYDNNFVYIHDWDLYRIIMVIGGNVIYDTRAYIQYRQHNNNVVGIQPSIIRKWIHRFNNYRNPSYGKRCSSSAACIKHVYRQIIPTYNIKQLDIIIGIPKKWRYRFCFIFSKAFRRSNVLDNYIFKFLALIGWL